MTRAAQSVVLEVIDKGTTSSEHPVPLLFVHGACHSAWCWDDHFLDHFADRGFHAVALSLRGHGGSSSDKPLRRCSIADFVDDVDTVAAGLEEPPVVVGHSMGGFIAQHYLEKQLSPAGSAARIDTTARHRRATSSALHAQTPGGRDALQYRPQTRDHFSDSRRTREALFSAGHASRTLSMRAPTAWRRRVTRALWTKIPRCSGCPSRREWLRPCWFSGANTTDASPREVHATARAYRTEAELFPMGHNMMLEPGWPAVAARIESWLGERGL